MSGAEISILPKEFSEKLLTCKGDRCKLCPIPTKAFWIISGMPFFVQYAGWAAATGGHPSGNGHQVAMPPDEGGIATIGQGKESSPIRSEKMPEAGKLWQKEK